MSAPPHTLFSLPLKGFGEETQAGKGAGPQSVQVVLGVKDYGEQGTRPGISGIKDTRPFARIHSFLIPIELKRK